MITIIGMAVDKPSIRLDAQWWARMHDGYGAISVMIMVMTTTATVTAADNSARIMVPPNRSISHTQDGRTNDRRVGDDGYSDDSHALHRIRRRRLVFPSKSRGRS